MLNKYFKDNTHRHKKEKEIDRYLIKEEKKYYKEMEQKVKLMEKVTDIRLGTKRIREENKDIDKPYTRNEDEKEIDVRYAIEKIMKHISNKEKFEKCLNLLKALFIKMENIPSFITIKILFSVFIQCFKFQDNNLFSLINSLYEYIQKEDLRINYFKNEEREIFVCFGIPINYQFRLITDDSFKFNSIMKNLEEITLELPDYIQQEEEILVEFRELLNNEEVIYNQPDKVLKNLKLEKLKLSIKRKYIFESLKQAFSYYRQKWAFSTICNLFKKIYKNQNKFSQSHIKEIELMIDIMQNKFNTNVSQESTRIIRDEKSKSNPLQSSHNVTDARSERLVIGDNWQTKQLGLNSKMYINN